MPEIRPSQAKEPMLVAQEKLAPWSKAGVDLFTLIGKNYVLVPDCCSHFPELALRKAAPAKQVIVRVKAIYLTW